REEPPMRWAARIEALGGAPLPPAGFIQTNEYAIQFLQDGDWLKRAVYLDQQALLDAGMRFDRSIRVWPSKAFKGQVDASLAPSPAHASLAIDRVRTAIGARASHDIPER